MEQTAITLDEESKKVIEKLKKEDDKFNFSEFVRQCIKNHSSNEEDEEQITQEINKKKLKVQEIEQDIEYLREKKAKLEVKNYKEQAINEELKENTQAEIEFVKGAVARRNKALKEGHPYSDVAEVKMFKDKFDKSSDVFFKVRRKLEDNEI